MIGSTSIVEPFSTDLTVTIDVVYTPPADFDRPSVNDFRAGSGPVTLTCQVVGATGTVTYQWTFTCGNCFVKGPTSQSVTGYFLRVGFDDGTHTCTATDSDGGETGSASTVMRIIGMFVSSLLYTSFTVSVAQSVSYLWLWFLVCSATVFDTHYKDTGPDQGRSRKWRREFLSRLHRKAACI